MGNLVDFAKRELEQAGLFDEEKDFYGGMTGKAVLELIEVFAKQGHSGMSASVVRQLFNTLAKFEIINPVKDIDGFKFQDVGDGVQQSTVISSVFKEGERACYLKAVVFVEENRVSFTGGAMTKDGKRVSSRQFVKYPFLPKTFYVHVEEKDGESIIKDESELKEVFEYYEKS